MLRFVDGFDIYGQEGQSFSAINQSFDTGWQIAGSSPINIASGFGQDNKAIVLNRTANTFSYVQRTFESLNDTVIFGFQMSATGRFNGVMSIPGVLSLDWPNVMEIESNPGNAVPILNTPYYVEIKIVKSTKEYEMELNGYPYLSGTLLAANIPDVLQVRFGFTAGGQPINMKLSNVYFADGSAGKYNDFLGPQLIVSTRPTESVTPITWDPEPANRTNVDIMQNPVPRADQYTQSDQIGDADYYRSAEAVTGTVTAVAVTSVIAKTDIDDQSIKIGIGESGSREEGDDIAVPVQPTYVQTVFEQDALGVDWDDTTATTTAFGITIQPRP